MVHLLTMVKCQLCDDFYHLDCCGIPTNKHESALEMIQLFGWSCKDCRNDHRKIMIKMKQELSSLQQQFDMLLARSLATAESATEGAMTARPTADYTPAVHMETN